MGKNVFQKSFSKLAEISRLFRISFVMDVRKSKPRKNDNIHTTEKGAGYLITSAAATESLEQKRKICKEQKNS